MMAQLTAYRGRMFTATSEDASCVVVAGERIVEVGGDELIARLPKSVRVVEVAGLLLPGFVDAHTHIGHSALGSLGAVDCRVPGVASIADIQDVLRAHAASSNGPIVGYGNLFYDRKLEDRRLPNRDDLDEVSRERPVILRCGGHISVLNSVALAEVQAADLLGYTGRAVVFRDAEGRPTGAVAEVDEALSLPMFSESVRRDVVARAIRAHYTANGVTTIGEICESLSSLQVMRDVATSGGVDVSIRGYVLVSPALTIDAVVGLCAAYSDRDTDFALDGVKLFVDGGYSSRTAAVSTPYLDMAPEHAHGHLAMDAGTLRAQLERARDEGLTAAVHVNGDLAQRALLEALPEGSRVRAEHAGNFVVDWMTVEGLIRKGVTFVINPGFFNSYIGDEFPRILGSAASAGRMPVRSLLARGARIAAGADAGLGAEDAHTSPLASIWNLAARKTWSGEEAEQEEAIDASTALRIVTLNSAEALGAEDQIGSLEPGKYADLVELDRDPREVAVDEIPSIEVTRVVRRGKLVYGKEWR